MELYKLHINCILKVSENLNAGIKHFTSISEFPHTDICTFVNSFFGFETIRIHIQITEREVNVSAGGGGICVIRRVQQISIEYTDV